MNNSEKKLDEGQKYSPTSPPKEPSEGEYTQAEADDVTLGDEAQKRRDKMQRQEKAEGDRR